PHCSDSSTGMDPSLGQISLIQPGNREITSMHNLDLSVSFPSRGVIRLQSRALFGDVDDPACQRFLERVFQAEEISNITIVGGDSPLAELRFCPKTNTLLEVVQRVVGFLRHSAETDVARSNGRIPGDTSSHVASHGQAHENGHANGNALANGNGYVTG